MQRRRVRAQAKARVASPRERTITGLALQTRPFSTDHSCSARESGEPRCITSNAGRSCNAADSRLYIYVDRAQEFSGLGKVAPHKAGAGPRHRTAFGVHEAIWSVMFGRRGRIVGGERSDQVPASDCVHLADSRASAASITDHPRLLQSGRQE